MLDLIGNVTELESETIGVVAEWGQARTILVNTPTASELFMGILHPKAALFSCPFDPFAAMNEHKEFIKLLENQGVRVINVRDVLLANTSDRQGKALGNLRQLASASLQYHFNGVDDFSQDRYKEMVINGLSAQTLVDIILNKPKIDLEATDYNTGFEARYSTKPLMNLYFLRDQSITTCKGVVMAKMNSPQREDEVAVINFVYNKLGITPVYQIVGDGRLEGGDFITAAEVDFIGQGLRTNEEAIMQLIDNGVLCANKLVVVKDSFFSQDQMHLDTYFNIIAPGKAVLVETRLGVDFSDVMSLHADIYQRNEFGFELTSSDVSFVDFLQKDLNYQIIPVPFEDQLKYGVNFITVSANNILAIDGVSYEYKYAIGQAGVNATWMNFSNLTCGYGAAHCTTQVIYRN